MTNGATDKGRDPPQRRLRDRLLFDLGATAQATVPGAYAWAVTVEPAAFARGAPFVARGAAVCGLGLLAFAPVLERRRPRLARALSVWGLVATSLLVWVVAPASAVGTDRTDALRGTAGAIGWALFALASCAPALARRPRDAPGSQDALQRKGDSGLVDALILGTGITLAVVVHGSAWHAEAPERALLVRLVSLSAAVMIVGTSAALVAARHSKRKAASPGRRVQRALVPMVLFGLLAVGGAVYTLASWR